MNGQSQKKSCSCLATSRGRQYRSGDSSVKLCSKSTGQWFMNALRSWLDPGSKTMAAQDFCHSHQKSDESVSDFICRIEKSYQVAYGKDDLNPATRDALLCGQLYEGLIYDLMQSPVVSGVQSYQKLCTTSEGEERGLAALKQWQQFVMLSTSTPQQAPSSRPSGSKPEQQGTLPATRRQRVSFKCGQPGHFDINCPQGGKKGRR